MAAGARPCRGREPLPSPVRIISGPRDESWDRYIRRLVDERGYGHERTYVGVADEQRARIVRSKLRTAGRHQGVSVKAYWQACGGCGDGGPSCAYHVNYSVFDQAAARRYKARQAGKIRL